MNKRKMIIDTDCGSDDAMAIAIALNDHDHEILMLTTVSGNVNVRQATANVLTTLKVTDAYYPAVYMGQDNPLNRDFVGSADTHGEDGMGDLDLVDYSLKSAIGNAVEKIVEVLDDAPTGEIDIVALGPLSNLAKIQQLRPDLLRKAGKILCMASQGFTTGNMTDYAEFNVFADPDAAEILLEAHLDNLYFVSWDACLGKCILDEKDVEELREMNDLSRFMISCNRQLFNYNFERFNRRVLDMADPAAMIAYLHKDCIKTCHRYYCKVVLDKDDDLYGKVEIIDDQNKANVYLINALDDVLYKKYLKKGLERKPA